MTNSGEKKSRRERGGEQREGGEIRVYRFAGSESDLDRISWLRISQREHYQIN